MCGLEVSKIDNADARTVVDLHTIGFKGLGGNGVRSLVVGVGVRRYFVDECHKVVTPVDDAREVYSAIKSWCRYHCSSVVDGHCLPCDVGSRVDARHSKHGVAIDGYLLRCALGEDGAIGEVDGDGEALLEGLRYHRAVEICGLVCELHTRAAIDGYNPL